MVRELLPKYGFSNGCFQLETVEAVLEGASR
jgi:hypothetical protein